MRWMTWRAGTYARHVIGCYLIYQTRAQHAVDEVAGNMIFSLSNEGSTCVG